MLDKKCKKIVNCCVKHFINNTIIETKDLQKYLKLNKMEIYYCCKRLNELEFFETFQTSIEHSVIFIPGYKLFNYKEYSKTKVKEFLLKSILIPTLVSVLASIIVTMLTLMITGTLTLL